MAACARPGYRGTISMYQTAGSLWTLTGDESVTSRVTFLTAWASIKRGHQSSLSPCFQSACHAFRHTVSPAFAFLLDGSFPSYLSRALVTFVSLSKATAQSNYPPAAVLVQLAEMRIKSGVTLSLRLSRRTGLDASTYAMRDPHSNNHRL